MVDCGTFCPMRRTSTAFDTEFCIAAHIAANSCATAGVLVIANTTSHDNVIIASDQMPILEQDEEEEKEQDALEAATTR